MDTDGFDPWDFDDDSWRDELEVMGEDFQEALEAKGIKRRFWRKRKEERVKEVSQELETMLKDVHAEDWMRRSVLRLPDELPRKVMECPRCHGEGGGMVPHGQEYAHESCDDCEGTGEIPIPSSEPTFRFKPF